MSLRFCARDWWNPSSKQGTGPLHSMNITRVQHISRQVGRMLPQATPHIGTSTPLKDLRVLDVGCGGGLLSESLARLGARVVGVDPSPENVSVAAAHAAGDPLTRGIIYKAVQAEELVLQGETFDLVTSLEVIEHVEDQEAFLSALAGLTRPGGMLVLSTINKTLKSFILAVVGAEYVAGLVPAGTHDWRKFIGPHEIEEALARRGFGSTEACGLVYDPLSGRWQEERGELDVNFIMTALLRQND
ncbi:unnamed protein product [Discosporangium mesarthrocarpum]